MTASTTDATAPGRPVVPRGRAGWWHDYVCQVHGTELLFDPDQVAGQAHRCPYGCRLEGETLDGAWRVLKHQHCARALRTSGRRYLAAGNGEDRAAAVAAILDYGALYREAQEAGWSTSAPAWMLRGKLFQQALTEAIWGVAVADGIAAVAQGDAVHARESADLAPARPLLSALADTMQSARRTLVEEKGDLRNNYAAWLNAAGALAARALAALGDEAADVEDWLTSPSGLSAHLDAAVGDDGWEWEGSSYYHLFVLRASLLALAGADPRSLPEPLAIRLERMLRVLAELSTEAGVLPVLHDGPYARVPAYQELLEVAVLGQQLVDLPGLADVEHHARSTLSPSDAALEGTLAGWFAGPPRHPAAGAGRRASVSWPDAGVLVLRPPSGRWQAVVDAGPHGGSHGHRDKLALYLYGLHELWQPAPGVPPYASPLRLGHYARTHAHPTVRVDGEDQAACTGEVRLWHADARGARATVAAPDAYPGVALTRHLEMTDRYLLDAVHVRSDTPRVVELGLRPSGRLRVEARVDHWRTSWPHGPGGQGAELVGLHAASAPSSFPLVPGRGPSDDPARVVPVVDWRAECTEVWFVSVYQPSDGPEHPRTVRIAPAAPGGVTVEVGLDDGTVVTHELAPVPAPPHHPVPPTTPAEEDQ